MDPITHILIAYCLIFWVQKFRKIPINFLIPYLIGSVLPDVDVVFNLIAYLAPKLYWIEHRAMGHSFVGVIPLVVIVALILSIPKLKSTIFKDKKYADLSFLSWTGLLGLYLGSLAHFLPDFFVPTGMMILFPFSFKWYGLKILSTNNIHSIAALMAVVAFWPLKWNREKKNAMLAFFIIIFTFYSSTRVAVNVRSTNLFENKYGEGLYSSNELIFTQNINYRIYNSTDPQNRTYIITTIDGMQQKFIREEFIPEIRIFANESEHTLALELLNISRENAHFYRLMQKNAIVCAEIQQLITNEWSVRWFAPIREAENRITIGSINYSSATEVIFHFMNDGTITKITRPFSV
ncbi:MAG: metal-dependent hydrolase [Candidatus Heimdallarchaeota archaeon]|nr:metal-dependent hydrolase [Candidatus Heimdallarchaeota archaeon]